MKIELRNIRHYPRMSEETECYEAALYIDGRKVGIVSNHGTGGSDEFQGDPKAWEEANAWCIANLPKTGYGDLLSEAEVADLVAKGNRAEFDTDLEAHCGDLLAAFLLEKDFKRHAKRRILFVKADTKGLWEATAAPTPASFAAIRARHPGATILNDLPLAEALPLYRTHGAR